MLKKVLGILVLALAAIVSLSLWVRLHASVFEDFEAAATASFVGGLALGLMCWMIADYRRVK